MRSIEAFPLHWPDGWPETNLGNRIDSRFTTTFSKARDEIIKEIDRLGGTLPILSSDIPLRKDGLPYSAKTNPTNPAIAVYFMYKKKQMVFACDKYYKIQDNIQAIRKNY